VTHYLCPPKEINMRVPDRIANCVGFISHDIPENIRYGGTAFLVGVKGAHGNAYLHLVTAQHVADKVDPGSFIVGMNSRDGGKILVRSGDVKWWYHPTEKSLVDAAVTIFATEKIEDYALEWIPESIFATDERIEKYNIGIGDELTVVGLFTRFSGKTRHFPIIRTGNIAMMPTDRIPLASFGESEVYLAEGRSIGGLSGSPVFVRNTISLPPKKDQDGDTVQLFGLGAFHFLGLMHGHWDVPVGFNNTEQPEAVNMGISAIVPAKKILEIIHHPELVAMRKEYDEKIAEENAPVADSELGERPAPFTKDDFEAALKKVTRRTDRDA
jgi:hypothetical protein